MMSQNAAELKGLDTKNLQNNSSAWQNNQYLLWQPGLDLEERKSQPFQPLNPYLESSKDGYYSDYQKIQQRISRKSSKQKTENLKTLEKKNINFEEEIQIRNGQSLRDMNMTNKQINIGREDQNVKSTTLGKDTYQDKEKNEKQGRFNHRNISLFGETYEQELQGPMLNQDGLISKPFQDTDEERSHSTFNEIIQSENILEKDFGNHNQTTKEIILSFVQTPGMIQNHINQHDIDQSACYSPLVSHHNNYRSSLSNISCREGESKRRMLLDSNPMEEMPLTNQNEQEISDYQRPLKATEHRPQLSLITDFNDNSKKKIYSQEPSPVDFLISSPPLISRELNQLPFKKEFFIKPISISIEQSQVDNNNQNEIEPTSITPKEKAIFSNFISGSRQESRKSLMELSAATNTRLQQYQLSQHSMLCSGSKKKIGSEQMAMQSAESFLPCTCSEKVDGNNFKDLKQADTPRLSVLGEDDAGKKTPDENKRQSMFQGMRISGQRKSRKSNYFLMFKRMNLVQKFILNMKNLGTKYNFRNLTPQQFDILEDCSSDFRYYQKNGLIYQSESHFIIIWEVLQILINIFLIFMIPIDTNFSPDFLEQCSFIHSLPLILLPLDLILKLNTAIYKRGVLMQNRREIMKKFIKTNAKLDVLTLLLYILSRFDNLSILEYSITMKLWPVVSSFKLLCHKFDSEKKFQIFVKIAVLIIVILTFAHTQATIFVRMGLYELQNNERSWIDLLQDNPTNLNIYIASLYWSMITMVTIGYGDIHPVTNNEMLYVSVVSLIACGIYGYSFNQIGQIVAQFEKQSDKFNKEMQILNRQMNHRQLNKEIQHQVRKYFEYLRKEDQIDDDKANQMIENLPSSMQQSILFDINNRVLIAQKIFALNFSKQFLDSLTMEMKTVKLGPEIDLYSNDIDADDRVYFIIKGQVEIYINLGTKQQTGYLLKKGDMFGEIEFLCQQQRLKSAKTVNVVTLLYINYKDFYQCVRKFEQDYEKYSMIKDRVRLYNDRAGLDKKCFSCKKYNHQYVSCPLLQYKPNYEKLIALANKPCEQERQAPTLTNRPYSKSHTLKEQRYNQNMLQKYIQNIQVLKEQEEEMLKDEQKEEEDEQDDSDDEEGEEDQQILSSIKKDQSFVIDTNNNQFQQYNSFFNGNGPNNINIPAVNQEDNTINMQEIPSQTNIANAYTPLSSKRPSVHGGFENEIIRRTDIRRATVRKATNSKIRKPILFYSSQASQDDDPRSPTKIPKRTTIKESTLTEYGLLAFPSQSNILPPLQLTQQNSGTGQQVQFQLPIQQQQQQYQFSSPEQSGQTQLNMSGQLINMVNPTIPHYFPSIYKSQQQQQLQQQQLRDQQQIQDNKPNSMTLIQQQSPTHNLALQPSQILQFTLPTAANTNNNSSQQQQQSLFQLQQIQQQQQQQLQNYFSQLFSQQQISQLQYQQLQTQLQQQVQSMQQQFTQQTNNQADISQILPKHPTELENQKSTTKTYFQHLPSNNLHNFTRESTSGQHNLSRDPFDMMKTFKVYFIHNNVANVLRSYMKYCRLPSSQKITRKKKRNHRI